MRTTRKIIQVAALIVCNGLSFSAQICHSFFSNYTIRDGFTDNIIHCIYQDSKGWIWLGTYLGRMK